MPFVLFRCSTTAESPPDGGGECVTFITGVAGRETVLTGAAELLFGVTAVEPGGSAAAFTLLLAPLAAPASTLETFHSLFTPVKHPSLSPAAPLTFFGFHVFPVIVRELVLYPALLYSLPFVVVLVVVEPQLLVFIQRPGIPAVSAGGKAAL